MKTILKNGLIINEGKKFIGTVVIEGNRIADVYEGQKNNEDKEAEIIDLEGKTIFPGIIDTHVHFREPGLTHKADFGTESKAALAGGVTTVFDMPNVKPPTVNMRLIEQKIKLAEQKSAVNYAFYIGATNDNFEALKAADYSVVPGIKVFMGSSTGNMLVDDEKMLKRTFSLGKLVAVHSEDEAIIRANLEAAKTKYGHDIPIALHSRIRSREACIASTVRALELARAAQTRLHLLHISTAEEAELIAKAKLTNKNLSAEAVINHLYFDETMYNEKGTFIKFNPSAKSPSDRLALLEALKSGTLDTVATDHAPHTFEEKNKNYLHAPSGVPMVQHSLIAMLDFVKEGKMDLEDIATLMSHHPAKRFGIKQRGFIRKGFYADITVVDLSKPLKVTKESLLYKCRWSPFEGKTFSSSVFMTIVNGCIAYNQGKFNDCKSSMLVNFDQ